MVRVCECEDASSEFLVSLMMFSYSSLRVPVHTHTHTLTHTLVHTESHRETGLDYRQVLERLAPGRDGRVTLPEIVASLLELSPHLGEDEAEAMVRHIHAGDDGRLPLGEFLALATPPGPAEHALESKLRSVFTEIQVRVSVSVFNLSRSRLNHIQK